MWNIIFALPNLNIKEAIDNNYIAIVPHDDSRIVEIKAQSIYARALADNFEDQFGRKRYPSFLIVKDTAPLKISNNDSIVGFRNIVAIATIIKAHEFFLTKKFHSYPFYSDYFDFYPITISKNNNGFITQSPSILGFDDEFSNFLGHVSPGLAGSSYSSVDIADNLLNQLKVVWYKCYLRKSTPDWSLRALFRSLEMAYNASAMPFKNRATIYDYGASASLWVSAFEILSHPKNKNANLLTVINSLGNYDWYNKDLGRRSYAIVYGGKKRQVNLSQKLYKELHDARNSFLHGNPVNLGRLKPFGNKKAQPLTKFAPLLYKVLLMQFLTKYKDRRLRFDKLKYYSQKSIDEHYLKQALLKAKSI